MLLLTNGNSLRLWLIMYSLQGRQVILLNKTFLRILGRPKCVAAKHSALVNAIQETIRLLKYEPNDRALAFFSCSFDGSVSETFCTLSTGAALVLWQGAGEWQTAIIKAQVTLMQISPSALATLEPSRALSLKKVLVAGESCPLALASRWLGALQDLRLVNAYGPSEGTIIATAGILDKAKLERIHIGTPISGVSVHILNSEFVPTATGEPGELYIGGVGVVDGYVNRPELTREKFIDGNNGEGRLYRTGDRVKKLSSGELEFLGRVDRQVKVHGGFRVEIDEIESTLMSTLHSGAVCSVIFDSNKKVLVAFVAPKAEIADQKSIRCIMAKHLPWYMIPHLFVGMDALPQSQGGKIDIQALTAMLAKVEFAEEKCTLDPQEAAIANALANALSLPVAVVASPGMDFISLGGNSLSAISVVNFIRSSIGKEIRVRDVFENPTVFSLARRCFSSSSIPIPKILATHSGNNTPASFAQRRLWIAEQVLKARSTGHIYPVPYNLHLVLRVRGANEARVISTLKLLIARHEILRTTLHEKGGVLEQHVNDVSVVPLPEHASLISMEHFPEEISSVISKPFNLDKFAFLVKLFGLPDTSLVIVLCVHHSIFDGASLDILAKDFSKFYNQEIVLPLAVQYRDFTLWQQAWLSGEEIARQQSYWQHALQGAPITIDLPADRVRPSVSSHSGAHFKGKIPRVAVEELATKLRQTPFVLMLSCFGILLSRHATSEDILIAAPFANRRDEVLQNLIGFFANTLALRVDIRGNPTFSDLCDRVWEFLLNAQDNQDLPFENLLEVLHVPHHQSHEPLCQVMFILQPKVLPKQGFLQIPCESVELVDIPGSACKYDITLELAPDDRGAYVCDWEYNTDLFNEDTIRLYHERFVSVVSQVTQKPSICTSDVDVLSPAERNKVLIEWNNTSTGEKFGNSCSAFLKHAVESPSSVAVIVPPLTFHTYGELCLSALKIAASINSRGQTKRNIAILSGPCYDQIAAILGILLAGSAFVPFEMDYPVERLAFMIDDANIDLIIFTSGCEVVAEALQASKTIEIVASKLLVQQETYDYNSIELNGDATFEISYTSGSTGRPKGVVLSHKGMANISAYYRSHLQICEKDRILLANRMSFIDGPRTMFTALSSKAALVVASEGEWVKTLFSEIKPDILFSIPSVLAGIEPSSVPHLRAIVVSGEACPANFAKLWASENRLLLNAYGSTEVSADCTVAFLSANEPPSIGKPISNCQIYILQVPVGWKGNTSTLHLAPIGVTGEVFVGGFCVAKCYYNLPSLTEEKFILNPFQKGQKLFRTGDLARWKPNGQLEFFGRSDRQIKVRGFRIETDEVANVISSSDSCISSVCIVPHEGSIAAFVCSPNPDLVDTAYIVSIARKKLPSFMVPSVLVPVSSFPKLPNGKVDVLQLQKIASSVTAQTSSNSVIAPCGPLEETMVSLFEMVLSKPKGSVSVEETFLSLGGDSLRAIQLCNHVRTTFKVEISLIDVLTNATPRVLVSKLSGSINTLPPLHTYPRDCRNECAASWAQRRLWLVEQFHPGEATYNVPWVLKLASIDETKLIAALKGLVDRHEALRTTLHESSTGTLRQRINFLKDVFYPQVIDLRTDPTKITGLLFTQVNTPINLAESPIRCTLIRITESEWYLCLVVHHAAIDLNCFSILLRDLCSIYDALPGIPRLPQLHVQYADFSQWQREWLKGEELQKQESFWKEALHDAPTVLDLPTDFPHPSISSHRGDHFKAIGPSSFRKLVEDYALKLKVTPFVVLFSAYGLLLGRWAGKDDLLVASPVANRRDSLLWNLIGFFANTLALRVDARGMPTFSELCQRVWKFTLAAFNNQDFPFESLLQALHIPRDPSREPLCQVLFVMQQWYAGSGGKPGEGLASIITSEFNDELDFRVAKYELLLQMFPDPHGGWVMHWEYCTDLFEQLTIERMNNEFIGLLSHVCSHNDELLPVQLLPILSSSEVSLLSQWNNSFVKLHTRDMCLHWMFEKCAVNFPDEIALIIDSNSMTYSELNRRSSSVSQFLLKHCGYSDILPKDTIIAIHCTRGFEMIAAILGTLKAGAAYLPVDTELPVNRVGYMLKQSNARLILVSADIFGSTHDIFGSADVLNVSSMWNSCDFTQLHMQTSVECTQRLAYIIFTSGSTGTPKGVACEHRGICNGVLHWIRRLNLHPKERVFQFHNLAFDVSVEEIFCALCSGSTLILYPSNGDWEHALRTSHATILHMIPSVLSYLDSSTLPHIRAVIAGGESFSMELVKRWSSPNCQFFNGYGPTEAFYCTESLITSSSKMVTIGRPSSNYKAYVMPASSFPSEGDPLPLLCPIGVPGELCMSGITVARGYLGRPDLTAQVLQFIWQI